jgi:hypothetical protein
MSMFKSEDEMGRALRHARFVAAVLVLAATGVGCASPQDRGYAEYPLSRQDNVLVDPSAAGWTVAVGPRGETLLTSPGGRTFDVGMTQYPDVTASRLFKLRVEELRADFLILYASPAASGGSTLTLFTVLADDAVVRAADIPHHWEWDMVIDWKSTLFTDSDGDGVPELRDWSAYRRSGTNTFYDFDGLRFHPLWVEQYQSSGDDDYDLKLVSRLRVR